MAEREYLKIKVGIGNYVREMELRENYITTFNIGKTFFNVIGTDHGLDRLAERDVNVYHVASSLLALGNKLIRYNNSGKSVIICDKEKNVSCVFTIEKYVIVLITVLDHANFLNSRDTIVESFLTAG